MFIGVSIMLKHIVSYKLIVMILILFISINVVIASPKGWKLVNETDGFKVWQLSKNPAVTGSSHNVKNEKIINWDQIKSEVFFKKFVKEKKKILSIVGIKDWHAKDYYWHKVKKKYELEVKGTYIDSAGMKVSFKEIHIYGKNSTFQLLHTRPHNIKDGLEFEKQILDYARGVK